MICENYVTVSSVEETLATLASLRGDGRLIAGGTDLVIQLQRGQRKVRTLVDISRIPAHWWIFRASPTSATSGWKTLTL